MCAVLVKMPTSPVDVEKKLEEMEEIKSSIMTLELEPYQSQNLLARVGKSFMVQGLVVSSMAGNRKWSGE